MHYNCSPPLEEEDIPMGDWICLKCYHKEQLRLAAANANYNSNIVGIKKPSITPEEKDDKEVRLLGYFEFLFGLSMTKNGENNYRCFFGSPILVFTLSI